MDTRRAEAHAHNTEGADADRASSSLTTIASSPSTPTTVAVLQATTSNISTSSNSSSSSSDNTGGKGGTRSSARVKAAKEREQLAKQQQQQQQLDSASSAVAPSTFTGTGTAAGASAFDTATPPLTITPPTDLSGSVSSIGDASASASIALSTATAIPTSTSNRATRRKGKGKEVATISTNTTISTGTDDAESTPHTHPRTTHSRSRKPLQPQQVSTIDDHESASTSALSSSATAPTTNPDLNGKGKGKGKGNKRAAPDSSDADEDGHDANTSISSVTSKRSRTSTNSINANSTSYSLRSRTVGNSSTSTSISTSMPRKAKGSPTKGKDVTRAKQNVPGSSRLHDSDVEMVESEYNHHDHDDDCIDPDLESPTLSRLSSAQAQTEAQAGAQPQVNEDEDEDGNTDAQDLPNSDAMDDSEDAPAGGPTADSGSGSGSGIPVAQHSLDAPDALDAPDSSAMDEAAAMAAIFGGEFRQFSSYMLGVSSRLKSLHASIKMTADPTTRLLALQELSELLSMSTEDTLAGFPMENYITELVKILGGTGKNEEDDEEDEDGDDANGDGDEEMDEDAQLAAALAMSGGGSTFKGDENPEAQVLACRCLANLMEALPGVAHTIVYHGAVPVLCSKLVEISYIDLAEQTLLTLEKISEEFPSAIVRENGLGALLNYLDFFSIAVQRTALQAASNCCRNIGADQFDALQAVWPILRNCLGYADQRLVEFTCLCVIRVIDAYARSHVDHLEVLVDTQLVKALHPLLLPAGGSPLITANTFTLLLRGLATCARASPKITVTLLEADVVDILYQILTGVLPPASQAHEEEGEGVGGQGLGGGLADMTVMENLAHRSKDQIEEALSLVSELMPSLPRDGVFDHKSYSEKSLARLIKAKAKADKAEQKAAAGKANASASGSASDAPSVDTLNTVASSSSQDQDERANTPIPEHAPSQDTLVVDIALGEASAPTPTPTLEHPVAAATPSPTATTSPTDTAAARTELLRSKAAVVGRFMMLSVPVLVDVYAASVIASVRIKALTGVLKAVAFLDDEGLRGVLHRVPMAGFASSILSSRDHPSLVLGVMQLVEMLLAKLPGDYRPAFRREGVVHELESFAGRQLVSAKGKEKEKDKGKDKDQDKDKEGEPAQGKDTSSPTPEPVSSPPPPVQHIMSAALAATVPGYKKLSTMALDPEDAITLRAKVIQFKYLSEDGGAGADGGLEVLQRVGKVLAKLKASEDELHAALGELTTVFRAGEAAVSSFELLQSGVVNALMTMATSKEHVVPLKRRQQVLFEAFSEKVETHGGGNGKEEETALSVLVKKLQESLTRMESYDVVTVSPGLEDSRRSGPSLLARQLRLRLVAEEGTDIPKSLNNIVVSIHAIATFQALHDYLRPRVAGLLSGGSRISSMLAALAAASATASTSASASAAAAGSSRNPLSEAGTPTGGAGSAQPAGSFGAFVDALSTGVPAASGSGLGAGAASTSASTSTPAKAPTRRRSQRLKEKKSASGNAVADPAPAASNSEDTEMDSASTSGATHDNGSETVASEAPMSVASGIPASETLVDDEHDGMDDDDLSDDDDEIDDEVLDDEDPEAGDKTISVNVADDGLKVEAQTPDGTRVATPNPAKSPSLARTAATGRASYAAALRAKPTDWHLQFEVDDCVLPLDLTIYGAIHQHQMRNMSGSASASSLIWQGVHTVKFKKVAGPAPSADAQDSSKSRSSTPPLSSLPDDAPHTKILRLLRVLHRLNLNEAEHGSRRSTLNESAFVNNKLTAKLTRQLEEPMIIASSCLPDWALDLPDKFPFLFPFATRYNYLQSTSFGYARLIIRWQSQQGRAQDSSSRRDDNIGFLGRLQRQKVRISRKHILESAIKVFEMYGSSSSVLEVEYFEEVGTGLGPTLEFYSLASREFARKSLKLWRDDDATKGGMFVHHPRGLFPAPMDAEEVTADSKQHRRTHLFRVVGQFVAKAMLDSRIIDMSFNKVFLELVLGEQVPVTIETLRLVDPDLAASLQKLLDIVTSSPAADSTSPVVTVEDLALDFTLPGYDIELRPGGTDIPVTSENVQEYVSEVLDAILGKGVVEQTAAFKEGFSKVFPVSDLHAFTADELVMLFGNTDEDWSHETLSEALKADHGFNVESRAIRNLVDIMAEYDVPTRRAYLQFITGSPKLPIGGFRGLNPPLTVVRKPHEAPLVADDYLPSVMTCVNYLKLPEYSTKEVMRAKLQVSMKEGVGSFHLS